MTMQRLAETAQGTFPTGITQSDNENNGIVNATMPRASKSKKKKKKSVNKSNLGSTDNSAITTMGDDNSITANLIENATVHSQDPFPLPSPDEISAHTSSSKKKKKKKKSKLPTTDLNGHPEAESVPSSLHSQSLALQYKNVNDTRPKYVNENIWSSNNNSEERQRIREFWLHLGEDERRSLVKVEKEAVLKKMKEQQKHSCNCSVCGKKRTAIEEELEILYDAYYEELEQYANHQQVSHGYGVARQLQDSYTAMPGDAALVDAYATQIMNSKIAIEQVGECEEEDDEDDEDEDEEDDDVYDDDYDEEISSRARDTEPKLNNGDHFNFGNSLTVKGGILTVADDLLKNDGKKFLDMMERLAERRMQREEEAGIDQDDYYDDDDEEDDDAYEDEVDEDTMTEEQRMEEGRRMFQIFAARMFEQRVLTAYREKIAQERQQRLLEELEEEDRVKEEREQKKLREKEKKKDKKRQLKKQKEEERLAKEAHRLAEEAQARAEKEKKQEEERQKREQERIKKEEEKRQKEEERLRKEEEKRRRLKEEKDRALEKERKRKEKEERDRKEREEKERQEREERLRKEAADQELRVKEEQDRRDKEKETLQKAVLAAATTASIPSTTLLPKNSQSTPSQPQILSQTMKSGQLSSSPNVAVSHEVGTAPALSNDTTLSLAPLAISIGSQQPLPFHQLPNSPLSPVRSPSIRHPSNIPPLNKSSGLPVNAIFPDQDIDTSVLANNSIANHGINVLPVGYPKRMSSQLESTPPKSMSRPNIAPIGKPPGYRRKSASTGIAAGATIGSERRIQSPFEPLPGNEQSFPESLHSATVPQVATGESHPSSSFFSLFGDSKGADTTSSLLNGVADSPRQRSLPQRPWLMHSPQRSNSISGDVANSPWPNNSGWSPSPLVEDAVHNKLFGDVLPDRLRLVLERARTAYMKLEELYNPPSHFPLNHRPVGMSFHPLFQLHRMYSDLYPDVVIDQQELLEACSSINSGFSCINHPHQGYLLRYEMDDYNRRPSLGMGNGFLPTGPLSPSLSGTTMSDLNYHQFTSHTSPVAHPRQPIPTFHQLGGSHQQSPQAQQSQQQQQPNYGASALFGGLSIN
ncbi:Stress response protein nst1 [Umbelopsis sp. WA50703]